MALDGLDAEIIVVDNYSQDNTAELVSTYYPEVNFIQHSANSGFSKANNIAIKQAKGDFICLINPDTIIGADVIRKVIHKHQNINKCGIMGVKLLDGTGNFLPESKINQLTLKTATLKLLGFSKSYYNNKLAENDEGYTATLVGAFMCFRAKDYKKVEGLDENYFMYGEDIDLSYQFVEAGLSNYYLGSQSIIHFKGESTLKDKIYFQRFFDSVKLYFRKHYTNSAFIIGIASIFFVLAKRFKKNQMLKVRKARHDFLYIYFISEKPDNLELIEKFYGKTIRCLDFPTAKKHEFTNSLIILDTDHGHYTDIIALMAGNHQNDNIFRIKVPQQNVLIGSDSSTSQGEIMSLNSN